MEFVKKPEVVLSLGAVALAGGGVFYTNQRLNALEQSLNKVITNVDAIGKTIGELRPKEVIENREVVSTLDKRVKGLDQFLYSFKQDFETFKDGQTYDNEVLEETVNKIAKALDASLEQDTKFGTIELTNVEPEEIPPPRKRGRGGSSAGGQQRRGGGKPQGGQSRRNVTFDDDEDDEDDISSKLERMRRQRGN